MRKFLLVFYQNQHSNREEFVTFELALFLPTAFRMTFLLFRMAYLFGSCTLVLMKDAKRWDK